MSCDIHTYIEKKVNGKWIFISEGNEETSRRKYIRFAALADVRGDGPEPRGLPNDISDSVAHFAELIDSDAHSHSWLPIEEAVCIYASARYECEEPDPPDMDQVYHYFDIYLDCYPGEYRLVFWFDN